MTKRLLTDSKITFANPYVVRLDHDDYLTSDKSEWDFQTLARRVYRQIQGTWGYSKPQEEYKFPPKEQDFSVVTISSPATPFAFKPIYGMDVVYRSYWVFKDEIDALQFRLMVGDKSVHVHMWPSRYFTIHEVIEVDES